MNLTETEGEMENLHSYQNKWFVLHHKSLYMENPNIIGFRDPDEWNRISKGDLIIYYQFGNRRIKGAFEVENTGINIDPNFGITNFVKGELKHQCKLKNIYLFSSNFSQNDASKLSFHGNIKNKTRWDSKRVFRINNKDLDYLLSL